MKLPETHTFSNAEKIAIFKSCFSGLENVYGTYNLSTGKSWQVKKPVTDKVIFDHLRGKHPCGIYLLYGNLTRAVVADFDDLDAMPPVEFVNKATHYNLHAYIETSKSKGYHVWMFFDENGVSAVKARLITKQILDDIDYPETEIFPKQDNLDEKSFGNFINVPLFGALVPRGKTIFINPSTLKPYDNQWAFLKSIKRISENTLDDIIEINNLCLPVKSENNTSNAGRGNPIRLSLPPCSQKMLQNGVEKNQRVSCFRLAVNLKRVGLPYDSAIELLFPWSLKNRPANGKRRITIEEITSQVKYVYFKKDYQGFGCDEEAVIPFCNSSCPVKNSSKYSE